MHSPMGKEVDKRINQVPDPNQAHSQSRAPLPEMDIQRIPQEQKHEYEDQRAQSQQSRPRLPLELEEAIIDLIARSRLRRLLTQLRLVSRQWIPRIDYHLFRNLSVTVDPYCKLLWLLQVQAKAINGVNECRHCQEIGAEAGTSNKFGVNASQGIERIGPYITKMTISAPYGGHYANNRSVQESSSVAHPFSSSSTTPSSPSSSSSPSSALSPFSLDSTPFSSSPISSSPPSPSGERTPLSCDHPLDASVYLPNLETLHLIGITQSEMDNIPISSNLQHLYLRQCAITSSQIIRITNTARRLQTIQHITTEVVVDADFNSTASPGSQNERLVVSPNLNWVSLTDYSADFSGFPAPIYTMDNFLISEGTKIPALRSLCLKNIQVTSFTIVKRLIEASSRTLETLEFWFERYGDMALDDRLSESLDLSHCVRLRHVTIKSLKHDSSLCRRNGLESTAVVLDLLPDKLTSTVGGFTAIRSRKERQLEDIGGESQEGQNAEVSQSISLKVSLYFPYDWQQGYDATGAIDRALSANQSVTKVELVVLRPDDSKEMILRDLPRLNARGILEVREEEPFQFPGWLFD